MSELTQLEGRVRISRKAKDGSVTDEMEVLEVPFFPEGVSPAYVRYQASFTKQIRQYEPVNVEVSVSLPCLPIDSEINVNLTRAQMIVAERLKEARMAANNAGNKQQESANDKPY
jgi:hypothetical protein